MIPFGSSASAVSTWGNQMPSASSTRRRCRQPQIITDLGFAPCGTGTTCFKTIKIQMGYSTSSTLSTTLRRRT
ncbi:MAG: hypothetical protein R3F30_12400 [Planctomycetota bacterium]